MRHRITDKMESLLAEIVRLVHETRTCLERVSPAAREEWHKLRDRFPSDDDLRLGFISLSEEDLMGIGSKLRRFRNIANAEWPGFRPSDSETGYLDPAFGDLP
jgi:hypothetical protein